MAKELEKMERSEAIRLIFSATEKYNKTFCPYDLERKVSYLAQKWNKANGDKAPIDIYPVAFDDFNSGYICGIGIEDEYIIFNELAEEWEKHQQ